MLLQWQTGVVIRIEQVTHNTKRYWVELPETPHFNFIPGQFVTLDLPISEQRNKRWRSYSIASMPDGTNIIELLIVHMEKGVGSSYIFEELKVGSKLTLRGPQGVFVLPKNLDKDLFLICTGTGIAPFRSMVQYIHHHRIPFHKIYLLFGTRTQSDLLYEEEMTMLEQQMPGFKYIPTLSRELWEGHRGYVHPIYEELCKNLQPATFMLCGWRKMIDEGRERIIAIGYDKRDVDVELYG
jgi:CDP-4-dehydro-6-deoxyglucose reductase